jgi:hypothetical protein
VAFEGFGGEIGGQSSLTNLPFLNTRVLLDLSWDPFSVFFSLIAKDDETVLFVAGLLIGLFGASSSVSMDTTESPSESMYPKLLSDESDEREVLQSDEIVLF